MIANYAVVKDGIVTNIIVLDSVLVDEWVENDSEIDELVLDNGDKGAPIYIRGTYDGTKTRGEQFSPPAPIAPTRQQELNDKLLDGSATVIQVIELLRIERGGS